MCGRAGSPNSQLINRLQTRSRAFPYALNSLVLLRPTACAILLQPGSFTPSGRGIVWRSAKRQAILETASTMRVGYTGSVLSFSISWRPNSPTTLYQSLAKPRALDWKNWLFFSSVFLSSIPSQEPIHPLPRFPVCLNCQGRGGCFAFSDSSETKCVMTRIACDKFKSQSPSHRPKFNFCLVSEIINGGGRELE